MEKLIRDKLIDKYDIPYRPCNDACEYEHLLGLKLVEESNEVQHEVELLANGWHSQSRKKLIEELADVKEVIDAILSTYKISWDNIIEVQKAKAVLNGKFEKGIILSKE